MDFLPIAVLILFVLLGGGIAVFADELGRRIGKRRLSLHRRIRPKTTARILTFLSGMTITLITTALITIASSDVRAWLREGHRAIEERDRLHREVDNLRKEQEGLKGDNTKAKAENTSLLATQSELQKKVGDQQKRLADLQKRFTDSQTKVVGLESKIGGLNGRLASLDRSIALKTREKEAAETSRRKAQASLKVLNKEYTALQKEYFDMSKHDLELDQKLQAKEKEVTAKEAEITDKNATIAGADAEIRRLTTEKDGLQGDIRSAEADIRQKRNELAQLRTTISGFEQETIKVRLTPLMYALGEEILRLPIPAGISKAQVRDKIDLAITMAKDVAKEHGAKRANNVDFADMVTIIDENDAPVSVETQKDLLASRLAGSSEDQVLIVTSLANAFASEGVIVRVNGVPNPIVYTPGQTLAEIRVDGRQEPAKILQSLNELGPRIRTRALNDKMIPIQKGDLSLGSVSAEDILLLVRQIQESGGSVRVRARAKRQTRAADPLLLDFDVR
jgi:uncharacterized protein (DUF3084 family)